jgi:hypothetical protein
MTTQANSQALVVVTTDEESNRPNLIEIGRKAIDQLRTGNNAISKATALFTFVLAKAWDLDLECEYKSGGVNEEDIFNLADIFYEKRVKDAAGKRNNKLTTARLEVVASELFGLEREFNPSEKQVFKTCLEVVARVFEKGFTSDMIVLSEKTNNLGVPYVIMHDEPDPENENDYRDYHKSLDETEYLDGKKDRTFAQLQRRVRPTPENRGAQGAKDKDKGQSFVQSVDYTTKQLKGLLDPEGESEVEANAIDNKMKTRLHELFLVLRDYFEHDPYETVAETTAKVESKRDAAIAKTNKANKEAKEKEQTQAVA